MSVMLSSTALGTLANALRMITWLMALCVIQAPMMAIAMMEDAPHIMHSVWKLGVSGHSEQAVADPGFGMALVHSSNPPPFDAHVHRCNESGCSCFNDLYISAEKLKSFC